MNRYRATIRWQNEGQDFADGNYSRKHQWTFDGGLEIPASASPHVVPEPCSEPAAIDPEEAFVASLSSCHMLWFLSLAAQKGFVVDDYEDRAEGVMQENEEGKLAITEVILKPSVTFRTDRQPQQSAFDDLQQQAHHRCFIANSVTTKIFIDAHIT